MDLAKFDQNLIQLLRLRINDEQIANQKRKSKESRKRLQDSGILCQAKFYRYGFRGSHGAAGYPVSPAEADAGLAHRIK